MSPLLKKITLACVACLCLGIANERNKVNFDEVLSKLSLL